MKSYKGFDSNLQCRGFQYEIGKEYEEERAEACTCGFHACEMPLDVFNHYPPAGSRFCEVEQSGEMSRDGGDSKVASTKIKIGAEIGIPGLVKAQVEWVKERIGFDDAIKKANESPDDHAAGSQGVASATGYQGAASATGYQGAASATGDRGVASATGYQGAASATGYQGAASATGDRGVASATGYQGAASATGYRGVASATGSRGVASATGDRGVASATGDRGVASATGRGGISVASGYEGKVVGALGCAIVCCERGEWDGETYPLLAVVSAIVDGEVIKADTWYTVKDGKFVEVEE